MNSSVKEKIRVTIFEDNNHLRDSLYFLLSSSEEFICVAAYPDTKNILQRLRDVATDVIVMDIEMPGMNGIQSTKLVKTEFPEIPIMIFTVFEDSEKIFQSLCNGGSGYLLKNSSSTQILQALMDVYKGGSPLSPSVAKRMVHFFQTTMPPAETEDFNLTPKEKELLHHLVEGKSYKMIADAMMITLETVKTHIKNIYKKLHVNSSTEAVTKAIKNRIV